MKLRKLFNLLRRRYCLNALRHGVAAGVEHERLLKTLNCKTVVDIGANRGQFALVSRHCFPAARIISFEPLDRPAQIFRTVFNDDNRVDLQPFAIGPVQKTMDIHISARDDSSSLLPITALQTSLFPGTNEIEIQKVRVLPLSSHVSSADLVAPALLKLDVQGYELTALEGCIELLKYFKYVYVECSFVELYKEQALADDVIRLLHDQGFSLQGIYNMSYDSRGTAIQADFLFIARNSE